jgi:hypothetical protein
VNHQSSSLSQSTSKDPSYREVSIAPKRSARTRRVRRHPAAENQAIGVTQQLNRFVMATLAFSSPSVVPANALLEIRLNSTGAQANFDNVRLRVQRFDQSFSYDATGNRRTSNGTETSGPDNISRAADEFLPCATGKYSSAPRLCSGVHALFRHAKLYGFFRVCCSNWVRPQTFSRENTRGIQDFDNRLGIFSQRSWNRRGRRPRLRRIAGMESVPRPERLWDFQ